MFQAEFRRSGNTVPYTPGSDLDSGDVVVVSDNCIGIAIGDIESGVEGELQVEGVVRLPKVAGIIYQGETVYWDANGNPYSGTAGTGAATTHSTAGDAKAGFAVKTTADLQTYVDVKLTPEGEGTGSGTGS